MVPAVQQGKSELIAKSDFGPAGFHWLTLSRIQYKDPSGRERIWECAERKTRVGADGVVGVAILALVRSQIAPLQLVLVSQFRPSQGNHVIEVPAGLIDKDKSAEQAAERELREETGYSGVATHVSPIAFSDPGMTNSNMQSVVIEVDADAEPNVNIQPEPDEGEFIEVFLLPFDDLYTELQRVMQEKGWDIDARLMLYAAGLQHYGQYLEHGQRLVAASSTLPIAVDNRYKASKIPAPPTGNTDNTNEGLHSSLSAAGAADDESRARVMLDQGEGDGEMTRALWWAAFAGAVLGAGSVLVAQQAFRAS